jgi:ribosomal protein S17
MNSFFINGTFSIINDIYLMRFLTEIDSDIIINIYSDKNKIKLINTKCVESSKLTLHKIDIEIIDPELEILGYKRYYYDVINKSNKILWYGSFPLITPNYKKDLKIAFVSCNDNIQDIPEWDTYRDGISSILWKKMIEKKYDIVIGMGDQIYADSVGQLWMDKKITVKQVHRYLQILYAKTYSEPNQSEVMRNCLNFCIGDDHDIKDCYATPKFTNIITNNLFDTYRNIAIKYFIKYQLGLINKRVDDNYDFSYSLDIGKYKMMMYDMRNQLYKTGQVFSNKMLSWTRDTLKSNKKKNILVILPRPIGGTGMIYSALLGLYLKDAIDEPVHPLNYSCTKKLLKLLFKYKYKTNYKLRILAGDVHETYSKKIESKINGKTICIEQFVSSAITRACRAWDMNWLVQKLSLFTDNVNGLRLLGIGPKNNHNIYNNYGEIINDKVKIKIIKIEKNKNEI